MHLSWISVHHVPEDEFRSTVHVYLSFAVLLRCTPELNGRERLCWQLSCEKESRFNEWARREDDLTYSRYRQARVT